jgi:alkanesulfonate monooxygenase SsuD/methylene tetrahydromethanopterin reductase-like flavin-dependent oxidoreductase (luciferase family)
MIANAGVSEDAKNMTARLCDWAFISTPSVEAVGPTIADITQKAREHGRSVRTAIFPFLIWGESRAEAEERLAAIIAEKDEVATDNWLSDLTAGSGSFDTFTSDMLAASGGGGAHDWQRRRHCRATDRSSPAGRERGDADIP